MSYGESLPVSTLHVSIRGQVLMSSQDQVDRVANLSDAQADIFSDVSILHLPQIHDRFRAKLPVRSESCIASG